MDRLRVFLSSALTKGCGLGETHAEVMSLRKTLEEHIESLGHFRTWLFERQRRSRAEPVEDDYLSNLEASDVVLVVLGSRLTRGVRQEILEAIDYNKPLLFFLREEYASAIEAKIRRLIAKHAPHYRWSLYAQVPATPGAPRYEKWKTIDELVELVARTLQDSLVHYTRRHFQAIAKGSLFRAAQPLDALPSWSEEIIRRANTLILTGQGPQATELLKDTLLGHSVSAERQGEAHLLLGWTFVRASAYSQARGYFHEARDLFQRAANDTRLDRTVRERARLGAARSLGAMGIVEFYMGDVELAEDHIAEGNNELGALRPIAAQAYRQGIGKVGVERRPRRINLENLHDPFALWLGEDFRQTLAQLTESSMSIQDALPIARGALEDRPIQKLLSLDDVRSARDVIRKIKFHAGWLTAGDAFYELSDWWLVQDWRKSFRLALISLLAYSPSESGYLWGRTLCVGALGRALHRAVKRSPYSPGVSRMPVVWEVLDLSQQLHSEVIGVHLGNVVNLDRFASSLRSLAAIEFDRKFTHEELDPRSPLDKVRRARDHHKTIGAHRQKLLDEILELRIRHWAGTHDGDASIVRPNPSEVEELYDEAKVRGCIRLQVEVGHEFESYLGVRSRRVRESSEIFSRVLREKPHGAAIL